MTWAEASIQESESLVVCKNNRVVRTIRVNNEKDGSCRTIYTKFGVDRVVGNAKYKTSCLQFLNNIKTNLEGASWSCREVANSKTAVVSEPSPE
jgi:hypothetical protein